MHSFMLQLILGLIGAVLGIFGAFVFQYLKSQKAEALLKNQQAINEVNQITTQIQNNTTQIQTEAQKRAQIEQNLKDQEAAKQTQQDLLDFLNKPKT